MPRLLMIFIDGLPPDECADVSSFSDGNAGGDDS
jgi:hypothetical protein